MKSLLVAMLILAGCTISRPFAGLGKDPVFREQNKQKEFLVVLTNAKLYRDKREAFDDYTQSLYKQLDSQKGYVGGSIRMVIFCDEVWTMTVWQSKEAMESFVNSREHLDAMYMSSNAVRQMRMASFTVTGSQLPPSWEEAEKRLEKVPFRSFQLP